MVEEEYFSTDFLEFTLSITSIVLAYSLLFYSFFVL